MVTGSNRNLSTKFQLSTISFNFRILKWAVLVRWHPAGINPEKYISRSCLIVSYISIFDNPIGEIDKDRHFRCSMYPFAVHLVIKHSVPSYILPFREVFLRSKKEKERK